jgi:Ca-activated chloride channel family protein
MYQLDHPYYLYLLISVPLLLSGGLWLWWWQRRSQRKFGDREMLKRLAPERSKVKPIVKLIIMLLVFASLSLALVNPKVGSKLETVKREGVDIVFALDVSKSMLVGDVQPDRLLKARQIISRTLDNLVSDRVGMIIYAGRAYPQLPITTDYDAARMFLNSANSDLIPSQGTAIAEAIELASEYFDDEDQKNRLLVILTDGEDHEEGYQEAARAAAERGIRIISVGIGTRRGGPIPEMRNGQMVGYKKDRSGEVVISHLHPEVLQEIASLTKGEYLDGSSTRKTVEGIMSVINEMEKKEFEAQLFADYEDQFQWFLGLALLLLVMDIFILDRKTQWLKKLGLFKNEDR